MGPIITPPLAVNLIMMVVARAKRGMSPWKRIIIIQFDGHSWAITKYLVRVMLDQVYQNFKFSSYTKIQIFLLKYNQHRLFIRGESWNCRFIFDVKLEEIS